jgi:hypothetical protein
MPVHKWMDLAEHSDQWRDLGKTAMKLLMFENTSIGA